MSGSKLKWLIFLLVFLLTVSSLPSALKIKEKDLSERYREWLKLTRYIILPQEKEVFMQLTTERDRDIFIEAFWRQRDPTPGTPQNEYKEEHMKRFIHANTKLRRSTPREGWMTDMGKIHILLGSPNSIERFDSQAGIHSCQVWYYYGEKEKGFPTYFALVFFQRGGSGEYKLYNPTSDGPISLLVDPQGLDMMMYREAYERISKLAPSLAELSLTMIPGQRPSNFIPSPGNNIILSKIYESPKKDVSPKYATHFMNYKGVVSTEYLTNYVENTSYAALIIDPLLNLNFVHFSISPKNISFDYFEQKDQYYCNFQINVSLRKGDDIIFQYSKDFPFYFSPSDTEKIKANGISIQDSFPTIEGSYSLNVLVQNSVGKEFSVFEENISVPENSSPAQIIGLVLGLQSEDRSDHLHIPFKIGNKKLLVDPHNTYTRTEEVAFFFNLTNVTEKLWREGMVDVFVSGLSHQEPFQKSLSIDLKDYQYTETISIFHQVSLQELPPEYYRMRIVLKDGKQGLIDEKDTTFIVSPKEVVPHPVTLAKSFPLANSFLYFYSLAYQYERVEELEKAEDAFTRAYTMNPWYQEGLVDYARFLLKIRKFRRSLELIEGIKDDEKFQFSYYLLRGKAYMGMANFQDAIINFLEGNKIYNSDVSLLNSLGYCYYKTNQIDKALDVLEASLRLNPGQKDIQALIDKIK